MRHAGKWLAIGMLLLFILEGSALPWLLPVEWQTRVLVVPHFVFVVIIFIALYLNRYLALTAGLLFGFLQDFLFYGHMIGTYTFSMALIGYLCGLSFRHLRKNVFITMLVIAFSLFLFEGLLYGIYLLFDITVVPVHWILTHRILPSLLFNLLFALIVYIPLRRGLEFMVLPEEEDED